MRTEKDSPRLPQRPNGKGDGMHARAVAMQSEMVARTRRRALCALGLLISLFVVLNSLPPATFRSRRHKQLRGLRNDSRRAQNKLSPNERARWLVFFHFRFVRLDARAWPVGSGQIQPEAELARNSGLLMRWCTDS